MGPKGFDGTLNSAGDCSEKQGLVLVLWGQ